MFFVSRKVDSRKEVYSRFYPKGSRIDVTTHSFVSLCLRRPTAVSKETQNFVSFPVSSISHVSTYSQRSRRRFNGNTYSLGRRDFCREINFVMRFTSNGRWGMGEKRMNPRGGKVYTQVNERIEVKPIGTKFPPHSLPVTQTLPDYFRWNCVLGNETVLEPGSRFQENYTV